MTFAFPSQFSNFTAVKRTFHAVCIIQSSYFHILTLWNRRYTLKHLGTACKTDVPRRLYYSKQLFLHFNAVEQTLYFKTMENTIHQFKINALNGGTIDFADYKGKKILVVNVASRCGYTSQYAQLQEVSEEMKDDLVIIGCPCNQFGGQESGSAEEIQNFCQVNFGVTFPLSEKLEVKGANTHPLYQWLTQKSENGVADSTVSWNFNKYLIDEEGKFVKHFASSVSPAEAVTE